MTLRASHWLAILLLVAAVFVAPAQDLDLGGGGDGGATGLLDDELGDLADELGAQVGPTPVRLVQVSAPGETIDVFWRTMQRQVAARTFPAEIRLNGSAAIGPKQVALDDEMGVQTDWRPTGEVELPMGKVVMKPGNVSITRSATRISAEHPAIQVVDGEIRVLCALVRFEVQGGDGLLPAGIQLTGAGVDMLRPTQGRQFNWLEIWLPVGMDYQSSWGSFSLAADGEMTQASLARNVTAAGNTLRLAQGEQAEKPARTGKPGEALVLWPHANRQTFARGERLHLYVFAPSGFTGGPVSLRYGEQELISLELPAAPAGGWSTRGAVIDTAAFPPGDVTLTVAAPGIGGAQLALRLVNWERRSSFLVQSMSCCTEQWSTDPEGLELLHDSGLEMLAATGHHSALNARRPSMKPVAAGLPAEAGWTPSENDALLERLLAHRLRLVDLTVARDASFYNEGLSYHHSYQPSVDRMVRRMSIFTQQTAEWPSFWGVNYGWFPKLRGYVEGGVATDAHRIDRMDALNAYLAETKGVSPMSRDDYRWLRQAVEAYEPADRERINAMIAGQIAYWRESQIRGFGEHNARYNAAVRLARPGTQTLLFDNAGHDHANRARSQFHDMAAVAYESYTDYGEWPMSAAFSTDWARGTSPGQPVWLTVDWGTPTPGMAKSLFHAIARGLDGGGMPMQASEPVAELRRRGQGMNLAAMYGTIVPDARPEARVGILITPSNRIADARAGFACHAIYTHLTRLGFPAVIVDAEDSPVPESVQVLWLVRQQVDLQPAEAKLIADFQARGGQLLVTGDSRVELPGATRVGGELRDIWRMSGFMRPVHGDLWDSFLLEWMNPLREAMAATGLEPLARTEPTRGFAVTMDAGDIRYAYVASDALRSYYGDYEVARRLPVSFAGTGWTVRDLVHQRDLPTREADGRTELMVDLVTEPFAWLALYREAPGPVVVRAVAGGLDIAAPTGVPLRITLRDPAGEVFDTLHRRADFLAVQAPALGAPGEWTVEVQELINGRVTRGAWQPTRTGQTTAVAIPPVEIPDARALDAWQAAEGERVIVLEPGQEDLLPVAETLLADFEARGIPARIWQLTPKDFDTHLTRWYPRPEDEERLALIRAGQLIGYRRDLKAFVDDETREHKPQRGGYATTEPRWMLDRHAVLFSGGKLAESLRAVSNWLPTPNLPGPGQGRLVVCFSPFMADRHVAVVCGPNYTAAAASLGQAEHAAVLPEVAVASASPGQGTVIADGQQAQAEPVPTPLVGLRPWERITQFASDGAGAHFAVQMDSATNTIAAAVPGQPVSAWLAPATELTVSADGTVWTVQQDAETSAVTIVGQRDGQVTRRIIADPELAVRPPRNRSPEASFQVSPDGRRVFLGRHGGAWIGNLETGEWRFFDDLPQAWYRPEVWTPRFPVGVSFSPDGRYVYFTMECRPTGSTNMSGTAFTPVGSQGVLLDTETMQPVWTRRTDVDAPDAVTGGHATTASRLTNLQHSVHSGFAAVSAQGRATALADFTGDSTLVGPDGKTLARLPAPDRSPTVDKERYDTYGPPGGVGVAIARNGALAAFAFEDRLVVGGADGLRALPMRGIRDVTVNGDGSAILLALAGGELRAIGPDGAVLWEHRHGDGAGGVEPWSASGFAAVSSAGELIFFSAGGELQEGLTRDLAAAIDAETKPLAPGDVPASEPPPHYREPATLAIAQAALGATRLDAWSASGDAQSAFGYDFHEQHDAITLPATAETPVFLHMVYRRLSDSGAITLTLRQGRQVETFVLDAPTPAYRVVDLPIPPGYDVTLTAEGGLLLAAFERWSYRWPGPNLALIKSDSMASGLDSLDGGGKNDALGGLQLDAGPAAGGAGYKDVAIYSWNPDPDKVLGFYLPPGTGPMKVVDGEHFGAAPPPPWPGGKDLIGPWFTLQLTAPKPAALVATYDRATRQSQVAETISVFSGFDAEANRDSGRVLAAAMANDQFWRLFQIDTTPRKQVGVHISGERPGLREVEVYAQTPTP